MNRPKQKTNNCNVKLKWKTLREKKIMNGFGVAGGMHSSFAFLLCSALTNGSMWPNTVYVYRNKNGWCLCRREWMVKYKTNGCCLISDHSICSWFVPLSNIFQRFSTYLQKFDRRWEQFEWTNLRDKNVIGSYIKDNRLHAPAAYPGQAMAKQLSLYPAIQITAAFFCTQEFNLFDILFWIQNARRETKS